MAGASDGVEGVLVSLAGAGMSGTTVLEDAAGLRKLSDSDVIMKTAAAPAVILDKSVAVPRAPKAVWDPAPPKALARSWPLPCWASTTRIRNRQIRTWMMVNRIVRINLTFSAGSRRFG